MGILGTTRRMFDPLAEAAGFDIVRRTRTTNGDSVLKRTLALAGDISTVIDVGASDGRWSAEVMRLLPDAHFLLIEAQQSHRRGLEAFAAARPGVVAVEHSAASDHCGEIHFMANAPLGGAASRNTFDHDDVTLPCVTIDSAIGDRAMTGPYLLKLDTHAHEVEILAGSAQTLAEAALVIVEAYTYPDFGRLMFDEMCQHMRELAFRPAAIADVLVRDDGLMWQMDIHFLPDTHPCFARRGFAPTHATKTP